MSWHAHFMALSRWTDAWDPTSSQFWEVFNAFFLLFFMPLLFELPSPLPHHFMKLSSRLFPLGKPISELCLAL
ncbi:MAG: hypothetical protein ACTSXP_13800 [Promethearchaeota archaeon]